MSNLPSHPEDVPYNLLPLSGMRRIISQRMSQSVREAPHFYLALQADMSEVVNLRQSLKAGGAGDISFNDILLKAVALALREQPRMNCSFAPEGIRQFKEVHLGFVVAVQEGLVVPVLRNADRKKLAEIAAEVKQLAEQARAGRLVARASVGGTFTVSNLGMFGVDDVLPIINPPQAGILGVGAIKEAPLAQEGQVVVKPMVELWLGCDHRAVDGVIGAQFLGKLKEILQQPEQIS